MTGRGYMIWADGRRYDGEWLENRCNGRGVLTYRDGRRYEGEYKLDKMHGRGTGGGLARPSRTLGARAPAR